MSVQGFWGLYGLGRPSVMTIQLEALLVLLCGRVRRVDTSSPSWLLAIMSGERSNKENLNLNPCTPKHLNPKPLNPKSLKALKP